jgi:hypothetical protein
MMNFMFGVAVLVGGQMGVPPSVERQVYSYEEYIARSRSSTAAKGGLECNDRILGGFSYSVDLAIIGRLPGGDSALMTTESVTRGAPKKLYFLKKPTGLNLPEKGSLPPQTVFYKTGDTAKIRGVECEVIEMVVGPSWDNIAIMAASRTPKPMDVLGGAEGKVVSSNVVGFLADNAATEIHRRKLENLLDYERKRLESKRQEAAEFAANKAETAKKLKAEAEVANRIPGAKAALDKLVSDMGKSVTNYKRINSKMDDDWYIQIDFTKKAIARHIEKLEQAKAGWSKMGMDQQTITEMTKKANDAIALGKATLAKGSAK